VLLGTVRRRALGIRITTEMGTKIPVVGKGRYPGKTAVFLSLVETRKEGDGKKQERKWNVRHGCGGGTCPFSRKEFWGQPVKSRSLGRLLGGEL